MKYWAFLSYSHTDKKWGDWLHKALETYRVPRRLVGKETRDGKVPERVFPIFRDREELPVSADLGSNINEALKESRYLIVICSPRSAQSRWVGEEIKTFKKLGREDRILALIVDGEPNASDDKPGFKIEDECFHEAMRYRMADGEVSEIRSEPIAADTREGKDGRHNAKLKLLAGLLGVNYDDLKQREQERRIRRLRIGLTLTLAFVSAFAGLIVYAWHQKQSAGVEKVRTQSALDEKRKKLSQSDFLQALRLIDEDKDLDALAQLARSLSSDRNNQAALCRLATLLTYRDCTTPLLRLKDVRYPQFSPDGKRIVATVLSTVGNVRIWDAQTGSPLALPMEHRGSINSMQFSPDGRLIVTASYDRSARVWDAATGKPLTEPMKHEGEVNSAQFSPDGTRIVTASEDKTARVWDAATGKPLTEPMKHDRAVRSADFSPDGKRVLTASDDHTARVWDAATGKPLKPMKTGSSIHSVQFSPDGERVVTASKDEVAQIWDAKTGRPLTKPMTHDWVVRSAQFSPNGTRVVTASDDKTARVWDAETGKPLTEPMKHNGKVVSAEFSPDGKRVLTASDDHTARVWDAGTGKPLSLPMKHSRGVVSAQFSLDGKRILTSTEDTAHVWDGKLGRAISQRLYGAALAPASKSPLQFSSNGERILKVSEKVAQVYDSATGKALTEPMKHNGDIVSAEFSSDGKRIITASGQDASPEFGEAQIWDAETGTPLTEPMRHPGPVVSAQFSPDGKFIVTASKDIYIKSQDSMSGGGVRVWDAQTGMPLTEPLRQGINIKSASFSADGQRIVATFDSNPRTARIQDVAPEGKAAPEWLLRLAEAIAGEHLNDQNIFEPLTDPIRILKEIREQLAKAPADDSWAMWGRWFLADRSTRTISPFSTITILAYIESLIRENKSESFDEAKQLAAGDPQLLQHIAQAQAQEARLEQERTQPESREKSPSAAPGSLQDLFNRTQPQPKQEPSKSATPPHKK